VVNYQGPSILRKICERLEIPIFNRITEISFQSSDFSKTPIQKSELAQLKQLGLISMLKRQSGTSKEINESDVHALLQPSRISKVSEKENRKVDIKLASPSSLAYCFP